MCVAGAVSQKSLFFCFVENSTASLSSPIHLKTPSFSPYSRMTLIKGLVSSTRKKSPCVPSTCLSQWMRPLKVNNLLNKKPFTAVLCTAVRHGNMSRCNYWWYTRFQSRKSRFVVCHCQLLVKHDLKILYMLLLLSTKSPSQQIGKPNL